MKEHFQCVIGCARAGALSHNHKWGFWSGKFLKWKNLCCQGKCLLVCPLLLAQITPSKNGSKKGKILQNENMVIIVDHLVHGLQTFCKGSNSKYNRYWGSYGFVATTGPDCCCVKTFIDSTQMNRLEYVPIKVYFHEKAQGLIWTASSHSQPQI